MRMVAVGASVAMISEYQAERVAQSIRGSVDDVPVHRSGCLLLVDIMRSCRLVSSKRGALSTHEPAILSRALSIRYPFLFFSR